MRDFLAKNYVLFTSILIFFLVVAVFINNPHYISDILNKEEKTPARTNEVDRYENESVKNSYPDNKVGKLEQDNNHAQLAQNNNDDGGNKVDNIRQDGFIKVSEGLLLNAKSLRSLEKLKKSELLFVVYPSWGASEGIAGYLYIVDKNGERVTDDYAIVYKDKDWLDKFVKNSGAMFSVNLDLTTNKDGHYNIVIRKANASGLGASKEYKIPFNMRNVVK